MALNRIVSILVIISFVLCGCGSVQHISKSDVGYTAVSSTAASSSDEEISALLAPYKVKIDAEMSEVVGNVSRTLTKGKPESTLGNWVADAMQFETRKAGYESDFAICNYGGIRVNEVAAGPLTRGKVFEICPFDNYLVIVEVPGLILDSVMHRIAASGGWPISSTVEMVIKDNKPKSVRINQFLLDHHKTYRVVMPDYIANGGDGFDMLIPLPRTQTNLFQRDALIANAKAEMQEGDMINATIQQRIIVEE